jgi:isovaleryl-CoA dehydrogenase
MTTFTAPRASAVPIADLLPTIGATVSERIATAAGDLDRDGGFPRAQIEALAEVGALGLLSSPDVGGSGGSLADAAVVLETVARADASVAMVLLMHYSAVSVIEAHGPPETRRAIAEGRHLSTVAFSERGSRSHFWVPGSTATRVESGVRLDAAKSWVTSAGQTDSYVWSSRPVAAPGPMTLWLVPAATPGIAVAGAFDGFGLRGNGSSPMVADGAVVAPSARLAEDGAGLDVTLATALPTFVVGNAAVSLGLMETLVGEAGTHLSVTRLEHLDQTLAEQPTARLAFAALRTRTDQTRAFLTETLSALAEEHPAASLRVLQVKAVAAEAAAEVGDGVMRLCGGAAFRKELAIERCYRDALAARVMAPTTEALHDFVGRVALGLPMFGQA